MRIAFLTTEYPTERFFSGGLASYLRRICQALLEYGHEVEVFCATDGDGRVDDAGVMVHRVKPASALPGLIARAPYLWRYWLLLDTLSTSLSLSNALWRRHQVAPFDAVQAASYRACGLMAALRGRLPVVTRVSSDEALWREGAGKPLHLSQKHLETLERLQLRKSAAVYAPSRFLADWIEKRQSVAVDVIEPPFQLHQAPVASGDGARRAELPARYGLFYGAMGRLKGSDRIAAVLPDFLAAHPDAGFVFAGTVKEVDGRPFTALLRDAIHGFEDRVVVLPALRHDALFPIVARADFVVLPSRVDNLPNTCLESMALGKIVIASRNASFEQLIEDGVNGFLVSQDSDAELLERMALVMRLEPAQSALIEAKAKATMQRFSPDRAAGALVQYFKRQGDCACATPR